ncbi:cupin domain-containing protein [Streptomyces sp. NRRL S-87]|uniref:cupin domain-containing protein n=1 Tax=Streptomyces sp. NRRL S-87 TaxID=1463920 RepID=UPI0004C27248|nr:cupin domain-containing protein [Streptomyces sp. NRRL S-87]
MTVAAVPGAIVRADELRFRVQDGCEVATAVGPALGAHIVRLDVVRVPAGARWRPADSPEEENVVVVFAGRGTATSGAERAPVERAGTVYAPTGDAYTLSAEDGGLVAYVWRSRLLDGRRPGTAPRRFSSLWNQETQLRGFSGTGEVAASDRTATMNFLFWPGTGTPQLCLHCGVMDPGEYFNVHVHPESEEAFVVIEGTGQLYLADRWYDASPGDVLYAAPGVPHGTRHDGQDPDGPRFATCGGPTPFDPVLYQRAGVSAEVR